MKFKWEYIRTCLNKLLELLIATDKDSFIECFEYLEHNELGLVLVCIDNELINIEKTLSNEELNLFLKAYYEMDCQIDIENEEVRKVDEKKHAFRMHDGGFIIAEAEIKGTLKKHFLIDSNNVVDKVILVKYSTGYGEIYINDMNESVNDNSYENLLDIEKTIHSCNGEDYVYNYNFFFNELCEKKEFVE